MTKTKNKPKKDPCQSDCKAEPAEKALAKLKKGNKKRDCANNQLRLTSKKPGQCPFAVILSCADSRIIPERIFNVKEGQLFVVRVAGNVVNTDIIASIEFAVANLNTKLIVILGHEECGAVKETINITKHPLENKCGLSPNLNALLARIRPAVVEVGDFSKLDKVIKTNAVLNTHLLPEQSSIIRNAEGVKIVPAVTSLDGDVTFYENKAWPKA